MQVPVNAIGVRTLASGGLEKKDHEPGFVLCLPGLHKVRLWDPTWSSVKRTIEVRGADGYRTSVDVSVIYRIQKEKCWEVAGSFEKDPELGAGLRRVQGNEARGPHRL